MRKKPLHQPPLFTTSISAVLTLEPVELIAEQLIGLAGAGDELAIEWTARLLHPTKAALEEACLIVNDIHVLMSPVLVRRKIRFESAYQDTGREIREAWIKGGRSPDEADRAAKEPRYALAFLRAYAAGLHSRVRKCALDDCGKVFFGDVRARWCSMTCGSKFRVRQKRRIDRERGAL